MKRTLLTVVASCLMLLSTMAQGFQQPKVDVSQFSDKSWTDVDYVGDGIVGHKLDVYMPKGKKSPKVIITIYGSAWFSNNSKSACMTSIGKALLEAGYAVVTINHRSSGDAKWPAQIQDVKAAIRYVRANAKKYGYDASFIGVTGFSSGGHLSTCAATTNGVIEMEHDGMKLDFEGSLGKFTNTSSKVDACVDWFGPVDMIDVSGWSNHGGKQAPEYAMIERGDDAKERAQLWLMSPVNFVEKGKDPEILIIHGTDDHVVGNAQSHHLKNAYDLNHVPSTLIDVPGGDHGPGCFEPKYYMEMIKYFDRMSGTKRDANFRLSTQGSNMVSPSTREEARANDGLEEILTIDINIDQKDISNVKFGNRSVNMIPFSGQATGKYFNGKVLAGGVDTQKFSQKQGQQMQEGTLSARYMLEGKDKNGNACKIFIENNGKFGEPFTHPTILTDSPCLSYLNNLELKGKLDMAGQKLTIRIYCPEFDAKMDRVMPVPDALRKPVEQKGTVETFNYTVKRADGRTFQKHARVYLPYGYQAKGKKKYNVVYLMHGGGDNSTSFFSQDRAPITVPQIADYLVANKQMEPVIIVTPTFYDDDENIGKNRMEDATAQCRDFHKELAGDLIPAIEKKYKVQKGREHRAFGGFSMGGLCTWYQLAYGNKDVKHFIPLSGDLWVYQDGKKLDAKSAARWLNDQLMKSKTGKDVEVYAYTGDKDIAYTPEKSFVEALTTEAPIFRYLQPDANLRFALKTNGEHWYGDVNQYLYYALPLIWK